ncbi:ArnT family glycosyltransferase [Desertivirga brevis]|uniref:ArnT family glycosyltransferase n=1 Tax=Desertivirga brevis TaxID=2810310 RepID=UPI001A970BED|nr:glycosyltransferase family 39 protein [Pedobacter sp. SYSU D00873]
MKNASYTSLLVFLFSLALLLFNLGKPEIYILDEAKNAECAREMFISGDYLVPRFNGQLRTDKPPLHYFFMTLSYKLFGVSSFSARFFSAVFGACTVLITYLFTRRFLGGARALLASIILISSLHFNFQMRLAVPDPYLIFFIAATIFCFYLFYDTGQRNWLWIMYICLGLGTLTKGPVAIGLPAIAIFLYLLLTRNINWTIINKYKVFPGLAIVTAIALPWFFLNYVKTNGEWTQGFFLKHNLERFTNTMEGHGGFFLLPEIMVVLGMIPFGVFTVRAFIKCIRGKKRDALLLSLLVVTVVIAFFSFSRTKLPNYTAPAYPFAAILIANLLFGLKKADRVYKPELIVYTLIAFAIPAGVYIALRNDQNYSQFSSLAVYFLPLPIGAGVAWIGYVRSNSQISLAALSVSFILTNILFFTIAYPFVYSLNPVNVSLGRLEGEREVVYYKKLNPAYIFQLKRMIPGIDSPESLRNYMEAHPRALIVSRLEFAEEIQSAVAADTIFQSRDTFESPVTAIFQVKSGYVPAYVK